jgi:cytochrome c-type biogenesis protein CcmH/NrfF
MKSSARRNKNFGFLCIMALSAATMVWMLWHFPVVTAIVTVVTLSAFGLAARLARWVEPEALNEHLDPQQEQSA